MTVAPIAAPFVSGLEGVAFAMAKDTNGDGRRNGEVRAVIQNGADKIGVQGSGWGRINAFNTATCLSSTAVR